MTYSTAQRYTTPISDLPNLDDLEHDGGLIPPEQMAKVQKVIRGSHIVPPESGMNPRPQSQPQHYPQQPAHHYEQFTQEYDNRNEPKSFNMPHGSPTCLEVAEHVVNCPICSKFYSNDKTVYIIAIIVLTVIVILLLK